VRIAHTSQSSAIDALDNDTPFVLTPDIRHIVPEGGELRVYYAGEPGTGWGEGLMIEPDAARALADAPLAGSSVSWSGTGTVVEGTAFRGGKSARLAGGDVLTGTFALFSRGVAASWIRAGTGLAGDLDFTLLGGDGSVLCAAGLGRGGVFRAGADAARPLNARWAPDRWYLVTIGFDCATGRYDVVVKDETLDEIARASDVPMSGVAASISSLRFSLSTGAAGVAYLDVVRVRERAAVEPVTAVGSEEAPPRRSVGGALLRKLRS
jgi:hypothetical protein